MLLSLAFTCLALASSSSAAPAPASPQEYWNMIQEYRLNYLPESLNGYLNETFEDGKQIVYDLYDDIKEEVVEKSNKQVDAVTELMEKFIKRAMEIHESVMAVMYQDEPLSDAEIQARNDREGLEQLRESFDALEVEVREEMEEDEELPEGVEQMVQTFISGIRGMMASMAEQETEFWSKLKQLELQFWQLKSASADTSGQLKERVKDIFEVLRTVDLNKIGATEEMPEDGALVEEPRAS